uniref:Transmembrane and coiled-coil domains 4 n=1 Tax=Hucho hucho TaxID=62062 RepID=A0A4W5M7K5_9TELE
MEEERTKQHCFNPDPGGEKPGRDRPDEPISVAVIGRQLTEPGRFAYAGLCGVSLGQLFPGPENRCFREQYLEGLVQWLGLDESVMPVMGAFLAGLGFEGSDTFLSILQAEALLSAGATPITQDLVSFSVKDGLYDSRSRVLIRHVSCLLRVSSQQLEEFEATLGERLREGVVESAEESSRRQTKERGRKLRRYLLIGLATVGGGAVIGSFQAPWCSLGACGEQYCLVWESRFLRDLGSTMAALLDGLVSMVAQEALKYTVLSGIVTALTWPASLLAVASVIDNPWSVCLSRSAEVGKHLAQVLRSRQQGKRPVSLIGFSLGARVIYFCLQELAKDQGCEGVVEDVVLLGAPVDGTAQAWERMVKVVAGKIVNGYCRGDWLLGYVYRGSSAQLSVAGLQPISLNDRRIFNVDLSSVVKGHLDYMRQMDTILVAVGVPTREVPGPLQPLTITERELDIAMVQSVQGDVAEEQKLVGSSAGADEACMGEGGQLEEKEDMGDGWDIPDISDLLISFSESNVVSTENILEGNLQQSSEGNATHKDNGAPSHLEFDGWGKEQEEEWVEGTESDTEHTSWSWEDTRWTPEHKHMGPNRRT